MTMPTKSRVLKYEGLFSIGDRIRAYDYDPKNIEGMEVFAEGRIVAIVSVPFKAYQIQCDQCTGYGREGKLINIPMERGSVEFDGRIVAANTKH